MERVGDVDLTLLDKFQPHARPISAID